MPIYEYRCRECGQVFEAIQKFSDPPLTECRTCPGTVEKLVSQTAFQLKGSGWYVTDYARKGAGKSAGKGDAAGTDTKGEAKPGADTAKSDAPTTEAGKPAATDAAKPAASGTTPSGS